jgi:hypothetical protein
MDLRKEMKPEYQVKQRNDRKVMPTLLSSED